MSKEKAERIDYKEYNQEMYRRIKSEIRIVDYATMIGYHPVRKGKYYTLQEHDSVIIDPDKNCFYRNAYKNDRNATGSVIDFSMHFENKSLKDALIDLTRLIDNGNNLFSYAYERAAAPKKEKKDVVFELPQKGKTYANVYAYLIQERKIDKEIIKEFMANDNLYQDEHKNCVFVSFDKSGKADFACKRGTNTFKRYVADIEGSNYDRCFYIDNKSPKTIVTESVIDAMSIMTLIRQQGKDYHAYNYHALAGTNKADAIYVQLEENPKTNMLFLALDNDLPGLEAVASIKQELYKRNPAIKAIEWLPKAKDWNQDLKNRMEAYSKQPVPNDKPQIDEDGYEYETIDNKEYLFKTRDYNIVPESHAEYALENNIPICGTFYFDKNGKELDINLWWKNKLDESKREYDELPESKKKLFDFDRWEKSIAEEESKLDRKLYYIKDRRDFSIYKTHGPVIISPKYTGYNPDKTKELYDKIVDGVRIPEKVSNKTSDKNRKELDR